MLTDHISNHFVRQREKLILNDRAQYTSQVSEPLKQLSLIWNDGKNVLDEIAKTEYQSTAILAAIASAKDIYSKVAPILSDVLGLDSLPECALMLGNQTANGHAALSESGATAWLAMEMYPSTKLVEIFLTHELCHAIHYSIRPEWYPNSKNEYFLAGRGVFTEGLATWLSMQVLNTTAEEALWADFMDPVSIRSWMEFNEQNQEGMRSWLKNSWTVSSPGELLSFSKTEPLKSRCGYFYGLQLVAKLAQSMPTRKLFELKPNEVEALVLQIM